MQEEPLLRLWLGPPDYVAADPITLYLDPCTLHRLYA
jgi:hypothetical protein